MTVRIVCYDIKNDKLRTKVAKKLKYFGCRRIQKSVFCGELRDNHWLKCEAMIGALFDQHREEGDSLYYINISKHTINNMKGEGDLLDAEEIVNNPLILWI